LRRDHRAADRQTHPTTNHCSGMPTAPEALGVYHKTEIEEWWPIIKAANTKGESTSRNAKKLGR
jgi:hypothetical protein